MNVENTNLLLRSRKTDMNHIQELTISGIKVKYFLIDTLKKQKSELEPMLDALQIEIHSLEKDIKRLEGKLSSLDENKNRGIYKK